MGLLLKASNIDSKKSLAFSDFIINNKIKTFAIFQKKDNFYEIINSIGFDGNSLLSSASSQDFWDGVCPENNKIYNFTCYNKSLNPILQFFSFYMKDKVNLVSLYKTNGYIYMLCNTEITDKMVNEFLNIDYNYDKIDLTEINLKLVKDSLFYKYIFDFNEAINHYINSTKKNTKVDNKVKEIIFNELYNRFRINISPNCTKKISEYTIKVLININKNVTEEHLINHLLFHFKTIIANSAELINISNLGNAYSLNDIKEFLQVD